MTSKITPLRLSVCVIVACGCLSAPLVHASPAHSASAVPARELVDLLTTHHLEAIAARDAAEPGRFVAALLVPGSQLLVVSAMHPSAAAIEQRITMRSYRDVYLDLQGTPTTAGKYFVQDSGADGIVDGTTTGVDVVYEDGARQTIFNRKMASQLRGDAYDVALARADQRYAHLLMILADAVRAGGGAAD